MIYFEVAMFIAFTVGYFNLFKHLRKRITAIPDKFSWAMTLTLGLALISEVLVIPCIENYIHTQVVRDLLEFHFKGLIFGSMGFHQYLNKKSSKQENID